VDEYIEVVISQCEYDEESIDWRILGKYLGP
jgi:hypothetical protein